MASNHIFVEFENIHKGGVLHHFIWKRVRGFLMMQDSIFIFLLYTLSTFGNVSCFLI